MRGMRRRRASRGVATLTRGTAVVLGLAGCSLLTPLDYVGGAGAAGVGGGAGTLDPSGGSGLSISGFAGADDGGDSGGGRAGGTTGVGGAAGRSGGAAGGGTGGRGGRAGDGGKAGAEPAGMGGEAGEAGEAGEGGSSGSAGGGTGGAGSGGAGNGGSAGDGSGGTSGKGGASGNAGGGSGGCAGANLDTDPLNCGECGHECDSTEICDARDCVVSACAGLCETRSFLTLENNAYRADRFGGAAQCFETRGIDKNPVNVVCWLFEGRSFGINDQESVPCVNGTGIQFSGAKRNGGYCAQVGAAAQPHPDVGFLLQ
jgi:hypothetical protein